MASKLTMQDHLSDQMPPPTTMPSGPEIMIIPCLPPSPMSTASFAGSDIVMATKVEVEDAERSSIVAALALAMIDNPKPYAGIFTAVRSEPYWDPRGTSPERRRRRTKQEEMRWKEIMKSWKQKEERPPSKERPMIKGVFTTEDAMNNEEIDRMLGMMKPTLQMHMTAIRLSAVSDLVGEEHKNIPIPGELSSRRHRKPLCKPIEDADFPQFTVSIPFTYAEPL